MVISWKSFLLQCFSLSFIRRSLKLIECLLRIADTGLYPVVLDIFKHGIQRSGELIFLGLLQLNVRSILIQLKISQFVSRRFGRR